METVRAGPNPVTRTLDPSAAPAAPDDERTTMNHTRLPLTFPLGSDVQEEDLVQVFHLAHALTNGEQHAERVPFGAPVPLADLLPAGGEVLGTARSGRMEQVAMAYPGYSLRVIRWGGNGSVAITAQTAARLQEAVADVASRIPTVDEPDTRQVSFWNASPTCGAQVNHRRLEVPTWARRRRQLRPYHP